MKRNSEMGKEKEGRGGRGGKKRRLRIRSKEGQAKIGMKKCGERMK